MKLRRYWFTFERNAVVSALDIGCGITAYSVDDALFLLDKRVLAAGGKRWIVKNFEEDVDISKLDQRHVLPNMGLATQRSVWFPMGF